MAVDAKESSGPRKAALTQRQVPLEAEAANGATAAPRNHLDGPRQESVSTHRPNLPSQPPEALEVLRAAALSNNLAKARRFVEGRRQLLVALNATKAATTTVAAQEKKMAAPDAAAGPVIGR